MTTSRCQTQSHELGILVDAIGGRRGRDRGGGEAQGTRGPHEVPRPVNHNNASEPFPFGALPMGAVYDWGVWHIVEMDTWSEWEDIFDVEIVDV